MNSDVYIINVVRASSLATIPQDTPNKSICVCEDENKIYYKDNDNYILILDNSSREEEQEWIQLL